MQSGIIEMRASTSAQKKTLSALKYPSWKKSKISISSAKIKVKTIKIMAIAKSLSLKT